MASCGLSQLRSFRRDTQDDILRRCVSYEQDGISSEIPLSRNHNSVGSAGARAIRYRSLGCSKRRANAIRVANDFAERSINADIEKGLAGLRAQETVGMGTG